MAIIRKEGQLNVVEAAEVRIKNIFSNKIPVYMGFSGGKDSLTLANLVYNLIKRGEIDPKLLTIHFIDEEGIYPCIEKEVKEWRKKFMMVGAEFKWFCIEVLHFNALNNLSSEETFICWDREKKDRWIRPMPKFAITSHPLLKPRQETYQSFLERIEADGITIIGNRVYESIQRLSTFSKQKHVRTLHPIYDWKDADVWKYLLDEKVRIPDIYLHLWQVGTPRNRLRVSQFFSADTVKSLVSMNQYYPGLMERVQRREPNAYLAAMYWDSEMFGRSTTKRRQLQKGEKPVDYKAKVIDLLGNIDRNFNTDAQKRVAISYRRVVIANSTIITNNVYKTIYGALVAGDPKLRTLRSVMQNIYDSNKGV